MRKLKLQTQVSIDGFIAGPGGEMDWMVWNWDDELKSHVGKLTESVDCIIMGKSFAAGFIPHWQKVAEDPQNPDRPFGKMMTDFRKVIFSRDQATKPADTSSWPNAEISDKPLGEKVLELKNEPGGDIIAYGGSEFVSSLLKERLVDELNLFVNPVALGKGMPIFHQLENKEKFEIDFAQKFDCGIVCLRYAKN